jgi:hypothetical protein
MDSFDNVLKAACHIKSYQMSFDKKIFDNLPEFYKTGLYYCDMMKNVHNQKHFHLKRAAFEVHRLKGIELLENHNYDDADFSFCKALCIFKYIKNKNKNWKNEGVKDEELEFVEDNGDNPTEKEEIRKLKVSALLNIALSNLHLEKFSEVRSACDEVIKLDPTNIKAYYRKAKSFLDCKSSTLDDYEQALKEITTGKSINPENREINEIYESIFNMVNKQKRVEKKVFKSFFRNVNYQNEENEIKKEESLYKEKMNENGNKLYTQVTEQDANSGKPQIRFLNMLIEQSLVLYERYEREGNRQEMRKMKKIAEQAKAYKEDLQSLLELNFENPNNELKNFAIKNNLDLNDAKVREEFFKKRKQYLEEINKFYESNFFKEGELDKTINNINTSKNKIKNNSLSKPINRKINNETSKKINESIQGKNSPNKIKFEQKETKLNLKLIFALFVFLGLVSLLFYANKIITNFYK